MGKLTAKQIEEINIGLKNYYTPPPPSSVPVLMTRGDYDRMKRAIVAAREYWEYMKGNQPFDAAIEYEKELDAALDEVRDV